MKRDYSNWLFWCIYLMLLGVLLPHTAWAFSTFEPDGRQGQVVAWLAAIVFEAGLAVLTHKLSRRIEATRRRKGWSKFIACYLSPYAFGLYLSISVSVLANLSHSIEFGREMAIFTKWGIPYGVYSIAFGGILPLASLLFAWVLSHDTEMEEEANPALEAANETIKELRGQLRAAEQRANDAESRAQAGEAKLASSAQLFADDKRERILAIRQRWPGLPQSSIAIISGASTAYVSEIVRSNDGNDRVAEAYDEHPI